VERIQRPSASVACSSSAVAGIERIQQPDATASPALSVSSSFVFLYTFNATTACTSLVAININRVQFTSASVSGVSSATCNAIEKWEPVAPTPEVWTEVTPAPDGGFWQPAVASASNVWQDAA